MSAATAALPKRSSLPSRNRPYGDEAKMLKSGHLGFRWHCAGAQYSHGVKRCRTRAWWIPWCLPWRLALGFRVYVQIAQLGLEVLNWVNAKASECCDALVSLYLVSLYLSWVNPSCSSQALKGGWYVELLKQTGLLEPYTTREQLSR